MKNILRQRAVSAKALRWEPVSLEDTRNGKQACWGVKAVV